MASQTIAFILLIFLAILLLTICAFTTQSEGEDNEIYDNDLLEIPEEHIYRIDENKKYYTEKTITRLILIKLLVENGKDEKEIKRLKKAELLEIFYNLQIPFPEVKSE